MGKVQAIAGGHTHRYGVGFRNGTVLVNAGTTGAAGVRGLAGKGEAPYSLAVLYWRREGEAWRLVGTDQIRVPNDGHGFTLERRVFDSSTGAGPARPRPVT